MAYLEELPEQCPPAEAQDQAFGPAYRILPAAAPIVQHFHSYKMIGTPKPGGVDDCRYASCSLFTCMTAAKRIARLPKKRASSTHLATLMIPQGYGSSSINDKTSHVDFWPYSSFSVAGAVTKVEAI